MAATTILQQAASGSSGTRGGGGSSGCCAAAVFSSLEELNITKSPTGTDVSVGSSSSRQSHLKALGRVVAAAAAAAAPMRGRQGWQMGWMCSWLPVLPHATALQRIHVSAPGEFGKMTVISQADLSYCHVVIMRASDMLQEHIVVPGVAGRAGGCCAECGMNLGSICSAQWAGQGLPGSAPRAG